MKVVGKMFGKRPEVMEIGTELKDLQDFVGGYIEVPFISPALGDRNIVVVVNEEGKLCGEVNFEEAEKIVDAITPVPRGVGGVTTSILLEHVVDAAIAQNR